MATKDSAAQDVDTDEAGPFTGRPMSELTPLLDNMSGERVDGVLYQYFGFNQPIAPHFNNTIKNLPMRDDDIITIGFPRSGNHFAFEVVNMVLRQCAEYIPEQFVDSVLELRKENTEESYSKEKSPRNILINFQINKIPAQAVEKKTKVVYLLRNPKSAMTSCYKHWKHMQHQDMAFTGTWEEFLDLSTSGQFTYGSWFDHVLAVEKFQTDHPDIPVHVHLYEDMVTDPLTTITKLCKFLETPEDIAPKIAQVTSFDYMKTHCSKDAEMGDRYLKKGAAFMRKGGTQDWKNIFTVAQSETFDRIFEEKMAGSKLADLVRPHI